MEIGGRLRQERERLGLNQTQFAAIAGATKQTLFSWEHGKTSPDGFQLARLAEEGVNVTYVLTGDREPGHAADAAEQVLLDGYRRCSNESKQHIIQTVALLAANAPLAQANFSTPVVRVKSKYGHAAGRDINIGEGKKHGKQSS